MSTRRSRRLPPTRGTLQRGTIDSLARLQLVKADLEATALKLAEIDDRELPDADRARWAQEMDKVDLAIARARSALLTSLSEAFERELPGIEEATGQLAASLAKLQKVSEIIDAVAAVLGVIEKVITLGR